MASIFTHAAVGLLIGRAWSIAPRPAYFWWLSAGCAVLPDLDVVGFALGIRYGELFGHRGFSHGIVFAILVGAILGLGLFRGRERAIAFAHLSVVTGSHGALDAMTDGGLGVGFFSPFSAERYFFGWRPIVVSPIGVAAFLSEWGLRVLLSEALYALLPALALSFAARALTVRARGLRVTVR